MGTVIAEANDEGANDLSELLAGITCLPEVTCTLNYSELQAMTCLLLTLLFCKGCIEASHPLLDGGRRCELVM